jgi:uncharacterized phage protein (TIGR02218 family)
MKTVSAPLLAHLQAGGPFVMADLYTIVLSDGTVLRWTDYDVDIIHPNNSNTYVSNGPVLKRGKTRTIIGLEVDTLDVSIYPQSTDMINGIPMLTAARNGVFDSAMLTLERAFLSPAPTAVGVMHQFYGRFADLEMGRTELKCRINSITESLSTMLPRNVYQAGCIHTLFDAGCGLNRASFSAAGNAGTGTTASLIKSGMGAATGYFDRGYIQITSGAMSGLRRTVKAYVSGDFTLFSQLPAVPAVGTSFTAYAGCDKLNTTCSAKFGNLANFRGAPFIPQPETAV